MHYRSVTGAIMLIYMIVNRWRPTCAMTELGFRDRNRYVAMLDHIGSICKFAAEMWFKHNLGRWTYAVVDESATGLKLFGLWFGF